MRPALDLHKEISRIKLLMVMVSGRQNYMYADLSIFNPDDHLPKVAGLRFQKCEVLLEADPLDIFL